MASTDGGPQSGGLKITLVKSAIGYTKRQKETVRALGLRKLHQTVLRPNNPQMRGMVFAVQHLLRVEEVDEAPVKAASKRAFGTRAKKESTAVSEGGAE